MESSAYSKMINHEKEISRIFFLREKNMVSECRADTSKHYIHRRIKFIWLKLLSTNLDLLNKNLKLNTQFFAIIELSVMDQTKKN